MSASNNIGSSFTIIPQSVHNILTTSVLEGKVVRANNESVFKGTFAEKQGAVLNDLKHLNYAKKVTWNDVGEKTGFSGFCKIISNLLHNFRSHFYSSDKTLMNLKRDIKALEDFGVCSVMTDSEYKQLKGFLTEIKQINKSNEKSLQNWKNNFSECLKKFKIDNNSNCDNQYKKIKDFNKIVESEDLEEKVSELIDIFKNFAPSPSNAEIEKLQELLNKGIVKINEAEGKRKVDKAKNDLKADISKCLERFQVSAILLQETYIASLESAIDGLNADKCDECLDIFKKLKPSPSNDEIREFKNLLYEKCDRELSLGDRLEEILEKQVNKYEKSYQKT